MMEVNEAMYEKAKGSAALATRTEPNANNDDLDNRLIAQNAAAAQEQSGVDSQFQAELKLLREHNRAIYSHGPTPWPFRPRRPPMGRAP
jgi:hypothetical protein